MSPKREVKSETITFRVTQKEKELIDKRAEGHKNRNLFVREVVLKAVGKK